MPWLLIPIKIVIHDFTYQQWVAAKSESALQDFHDPKDLIDLMLAKYETWLSPERGDLIIISFLNATTHGSH